MNEATDPQNVIDRLREAVNSRARMHAQGTITPPSGAELLAVHWLMPADDLLEHLFIEARRLAELRGSLVKAIPTIEQPTDSMMLLQSTRDVLVARIDQAIADIALMRHVLQERFSLTDTTS